MLLTISVKFDTGKQYHKISATQVSGCKPLHPTEIICNEAIWGDIQSVQWCPKTKVLMVQRGLHSADDIGACLCEEYRNGRTPSLR